MSKAKIIDKKSEKSIKYERELLSRLKHPFIVNMQYAFQDFENLYLVMDLLTGGDLRYHVSRHRRFNEEQTKFFVACIVLGLEYLHENSVLHRDIKPENLVLDEKGYVRITDFGIAKVYQRENSSETSGTPGYMSPEVMCGQNHTIAVDYFALGVIAYEFMNGKRPYVGKSRKEIKEQIMARQAGVKLADIPEDWSEESADFINKCLQRKPINRLGLKGAHELKEHPWLKDYPWKDLYEKTIPSPFIPRLGDNFDRKYCESQDVIGNNTLERYNRYVRDENFINVFKNFTYINLDQYGIDELDTKSLKKEPEKKTQSPISSRMSSSSTSKLGSSSSLKNYNLDLLKQKVKLGESASKMSLSSTIKKNAMPQKKIVVTNKATSSSTNYMTGMSKVSSTNNIASNNTNSTLGKYTPTREKPVMKPLTHSRSKSKGSTSDISTLVRSKNLVLGSTSTASLLHKGASNTKLPNIGYLDKLKLIKGLNSSSTSTIIKHYRHNSISQSSTAGSSVGSYKFINKL